MRALSDLGPQSSAAQDDATQGELRARLDELAIRGDVEGAPDATSGADLDQILAEIDSIMLPREVTVFCGPMAVARLVISQRRLVGLALVDGGSGDLIDGVRRLLQTCDGQSLRFQRHVAHAPIGAESLSAEMIRSRLCTMAASDPTQWQRFGVEIAPHVLAWREVSGDGQTRQMGAAQDQMVLEGVSRNMQSTHAIGAKAQALFLPLPERYPDHVLLVARAERQHFLALVRAPAVTEVVALWQRMFDRV